MTPLPQAVEVRDCGEAAGGLFQHLTQLASAQPALAFACVPFLRTDEQRDVVRRQAFAAALLREPATAKRYLNDVIGRPWVAEAGFLPALRLAQETNSRLLLIAAARKNPGLALREVGHYIALPFGQEAFDEAAAAAPDQAAGLAGGNSVESVHVLRALTASTRPEILVIAEIARDSSLNNFQRERVSVFFREIAAGRLTIATAVQLTGDDKFLQAVARLRLNATGSDEALYDAILERAAQILFWTYQDKAANLRRLSAAEIYLLLAYGPTEEDDQVFDAIFEKLLLPKMRREKLAATGKLRLRSFLAAAAAHGKLKAFAGATGDPELITRTVRDINSIEEALEEGEVIDAISSPEQWKLLKIEIESSRRAARYGDGIYGLLAVRLARRMQSTDWTLANKYASYYRPATQLFANSVFDAGGICLQRYFFYNDEDGIESFKSFMSEYTTDPAWTVENGDSYVHLIGKGKPGRRIEIYANRPTADGQVAISRLLSDRGIEPSVFVHRGHSFHVEKSLRYLTPSSKLVYLGSCRGVGASLAAIAKATEAQVIMTRGVGALNVNDPLLKKLNEALLQGAPVIEWGAFWKTLENQFGGDPNFKDYIPPHQNQAATMMRAYYRYLNSNADSDQR